MSLPHQRHTHADQAYERFLSNGMAEGTERPHNRPPSSYLCWLIALVMVISLPWKPAAQSQDRPAGAADGGVVSNPQIDDPKADDSAKAFVNAPGDSFRDCPVCPEMIVVPAGTFLMGSSHSEWGHSAAEAPRRQVTIETPFAFSKYEITNAEWQACLAEDGCLDWQSYRHEGAENLPATGLPWKVIPGYLGWLNKMTGQDYRLPTEAEWEYVARAGTTTAYAFGDELMPALANFGDRIGDPVEVGSYPPNAWGVHDMHGNVGEWVDDCWHESYAAPTDGSAWTPDCLLRVVRGGSWESAAEAVRSASRSYDVDANAGIRIGFRVVRAIEP